MNILSGDDQIRLRKLTRALVRLQFHCYLFPCLKDIQSDNIFTFGFMDALCLMLVLYSDFTLFLC